MSNHDEIRDSVVRAAERSLAERARRIERLRACDSELIALARAVFESDEGAASWLLRPTHVLAGLHRKAPVDLLGTADGRARVRQLLLRIEYSIPP